MKHLILFLLLTLISCGNSPNFPSKITEAELSGESAKQYYRIFGSFIHQANGEFTAKQGKVLFKKIQNGIEVAFYIPNGNHYELISSPVRIKSASGATATALPEHNVPAYKLHNKGKLVSFVFIKKGEVHVQKP